MKDLQVQQSVKVSMFCVLQKSNLKVNKNADGSNFNQNFTVNILEQKMCQVILSNIPHSLQLLYVVLRSCWLVWNIFFLWLYIKPIYSAQTALLDCFPPNSLLYIISFHEPSLFMSGGFHYTQIYSKNIRNFPNRYQIFFSKEFFNSLDVFLVQKSSRMPIANFQ